MTAAAKYLATVVIFCFVISVYQNIKTHIILVSFDYASDKLIETNYAINTGENDITNDYIEKMERVEMEEQDTAAESVNEAERDTVVIVMNDNDDDDDDNDAEISRKFQIAPRHDYVASSFNPTGGYPTIR